MEEPWKNVIWRSKPELQKLLETHGPKSVLDYFSSTTASAYSGSERDEEFISVFRKETERILGREVAERAVDALKKQWMVSTADHHGPLCHPFFLYSNLAQSIVNRQKGISAVAVLSCGGISLNNSSFPRGLFAHDVSGAERRLHFASLKHRHHPVFGFPAYTAKDIGSAREEINAQFEEGSSKALHEILSSSFGSEEALRFKLYADQCSWGNHALWKKVPGEEETDMVYLQQETIVVDLLVEHHLLKDTVINRLLLDPEWRQKFLERFEGVQGAFSADGKGTTFFWLLQEGKRLPLVLHGDELFAVGARWSIELKADAIRSALLRKEIFPGMALTFILLAFYYGLQCGGGFSQINYLGDMKNAWLGLLEDLNDPEADILSSKSVVTNAFRGDIVLLKDDPAPPSSLDLVLRKELALTLSSLVASLSMEEAISPMMPEYYKIIEGHYPEGF
jgi:hypothetical protein